MSARECPMEHEVAVAVRRGAASDTLRAHARGCAICGPAAAVAAALSSLNDDDIPSRPMVDARVLWLKAQLSPGSLPAVASGAVSRGVATVWGVVAACWAVFITWRWAELRQLLESMTPERLLLGGAGSASLPVASLAVVVVMAAVTLGIMLHQVFVEEL